jgi:hypothetical protein
MTVRVYDLSDLAMAMAVEEHPLPPDERDAWTYEGGGGGGGGGQGLFGGGGTRQPAAKPVEPQVTDYSPESVAMQIRNLVSPASWVQPAHIALMGHRLVVRQSAEVHAEIEKFLADLRDPNATRTFCIRTYWIVLPPEQLATLGIGKAMTGEHSTIAEDVFAKLPVAASGQVSSLNGQTVYLVAGHELSSVVDVNPIVGSGAVGLDPNVQIIRSGLGVQFKATLTHNPEEAVLDVRARASEVELTPEKRLRIEVPATQPLAVAGETDIDRQRRQVQELAATLKIPLGKKTLIAGMTADPNAETSPVVFLVVEVTCGK